MLRWPDAPSFVEVNMQPTHLLLSGLCALLAGRLLQRKRGAVGRCLLFEGYSTSTCSVCANVHIKA